MRSPIPATDAFWQLEAVCLIQSALKKWPAQQRFAVGCSGGRDSLALAWVLAHCALGRVRLLHVNHQLHADSSDWAQQVTRWAAEHDIGVEVLPVTVAQGNLEQAARQARYAAFAAALADDEVLVLGHHAQDQAETLLMRVMSGSGLMGLQAMRELTALPSSASMIWRPWLHLPREKISALAAQYALHYVDDPANQQSRYTRVWMRQHVWPMLEQRWPQVTASLVHSASRLQDASSIVEEVVTDALRACLVEGEDALSLMALQQLSEAKQRLVLSQWMQNQHPYAPSHRVIEEIRGWWQQQIRADAQLQVHWNQQWFCRYQQRLYRVKHWPEAAKSCHIQVQDRQQWTLACGHFFLQHQHVCSSGLAVGEVLHFEPRQEGMYIEMGAGHQSLKKILQQWRVPPWQRPSVLVVFYQHQAVGVLSHLGVRLTPYGHHFLQGWHIQRLSDPMQKPQDLQA